MQREVQEEENGREEQAEEERGGGGAETPAEEDATTPTAARARAALVNTSYVPEVSWHVLYMNESSTTTP